MKNELYHSYTYYGKDVTDGLQHWKYVKRYRGRDGKYRYVYANKETHNSIKNDLKTEKMYADSSKDYDKEAEKKWNIYERAQKYDIGTEQDKKKLVDGYLSDRSAAVEKKSKSDEYYYNAFKTIENNSVSKIKKEAIDTGKNAVKKIFKLLF